MPEIYVFGGCNGSSKTTFLSSLPGVEFVNADTIAADLNPNDVDSVAIQASRLMLERLRILSARNLDFAFETTLAARTFAKFLKQCQKNSYKNLATNYRRLIMNNSIPDKLSTIGKVQIKS
jgi:predicted ABC-type ATPase